MFYKVEQEARGTRHHDSPLQSRNYWGRTKDVDYVAQELIQSAECGNTFLPLRANLVLRRVNLVLYPKPFSPAE